MSKTESFKYGEKFVTIRQTEEGDKVVGLRTDSWAEYDYATLYVEEIGDNPDFVYWLLVLVQFIYAGGKAIGLYGKDAETEARWVADNHHTRVWKAFNHQYMCWENRHHDTSKFAFWEFVDLLVEAVNPPAELDHKNPFQRREVEKPSVGWEGQLWGEELVSEVETQLAVGHEAAVAEASRDHDTAATQWYLASEYAGHAEKSLIKNWYQTPLTGFTQTEQRTAIAAELRARLAVLPKWKQKIKLAGWPIGLVDEVLFP